MLCVLGPMLCINQIPLKKVPLCFDRSAIATVDTGWTMPVLCSEAIIVIVLNQLARSAGRWHANEGGMNLLIESFVEENLSLFDS